MDGDPHREFFSHPTHPHHRRYEALRAVCLEGRPQKEVAERFGYQYNTLRQMVYEFRQQALDPGDASPFFVSRSSDVPPRGQGEPRPPRSRRPRWRTVRN